MGLYIYALLCFLLPNTVWIVCNRKKLKGRAHVIRHIIWCYIFMFYCFLAVYDAAGIGTIWDLISYGKLDDTINLIPFSSEGAMTYVLNVFMFMPLGFLLPLIWKRFRNCRKVLIVGFGMSLAIEICQLFCYRATDVDDLIMNTLGTLVGYLIWLLYKRVFQKIGTKAIQICDKEAVIYITLGILGIVLFYNWRLFYG